MHIDIIDLGLKAECLAFRLYLKSGRVPRVLYDIMEAAAAYKANFDPNQPRKPAGESGGGRWTDTASDLMADLFDLMPTPQFKILSAWRNWRRISKGLWRLGTHKTAQKWLNRILKRDGFLPKNISDIIEHGAQQKVPNNVNPGNTATQFTLKDRGFVVKDDVTQEIIQYGDKTMKPNKPLN